ncbi:MAG: efflux RND transporter periplasmic adaptor subunit [Candidatus Aminicenantes bacterium]|nr:MAG: efflux RND transporter periplasmic adaptor subunit [Candidatus Aminicenantes bacterium]
MIFPKKVLIVSFVVFVAALIVFFVFIRPRSDESAGESAQESTEEKQKAEETPLPVKVVSAQKGDLVIKLKSPGEAVTDRIINMKAEVSGIIKRLNVEEGRHVKRGDMLVVLDDASYKLDLESAEASRLQKLSELMLDKRFAESEEMPSSSDKTEVQRIINEFEKASELYRKGLISRKEFEKAEIALIESGEKKDEIMAAAKGLTQAEINVKKAQMNLDKTIIRAPFSGIVCDILVSPEEHVTAGRELFTLVNISQIRVHAKVLESEIGKMKIGRKVELRFSAYSGKTFKGKVKAISPIVDPDDRTCKVIIDVANPEEEVKPGMHAEVEIAAEIHQNRLLIPQEAVLVRSGRKLVFVVENGLAKWRYVEVGLENEDFAEVLDGIKEGEPVIIEGHFTLAHDARVRIVE